MPSARTLWRWFFPGAMLSPRRNAALRGSQLNAAEAKSEESPDRLALHDRSPRGSRRGAGGDLKAPRDDQQAVWEAGYGGRTARSCEGDGPDMVEAAAASSERPLAVPQVGSVRHRLQWLTGSNRARDIEDAL